MKYEEIINIPLNQLPLRRLRVITTKNDLKEFFLKDFKIVVTDITIINQSSTQSLGVVFNEENDTITVGSSESLSIEDTIITSVDITNVDATQGITVIIHYIEVDY